ncbi:MAG: hypothetical protein KGK03_10145 [Candidatus Omnitrophica bacterium]|nr:hypothetical protein [Candidatus Omnitrophota bacterium]
MVILYTLLVVSVCSLVFLSAWRVRFYMGSLRSKKLPVKGRATMFDVRHLLMEGERELAVQLYCEIFQTTPLKAKKDIEELERSLKV